MFVPKTFRETDDFLATVLLFAPEFEVINKRRSEQVTLDMMMESLRSGINSVAATAKNSEASALFRKCLQDIDVAHQLYRENKITEAKQRIQAAQLVFEEGGKLRSKKGTGQPTVDDEEE
jgi:hypothetical protein